MPRTLDNFWVEAINMNTKSKNKNQEVRQPKGDAIQCKKCGKVSIIDNCRFCVHSEFVKKKLICKYAIQGTVI